MGGEIGGGCGHDHGHGGHDHDHHHEESDHSHGHDDNMDRDLEDDTNEATNEIETHSHGDHHEHHDHDHHHHDHEEIKGTRNINLDAAFLHALGDMFLSLGVCIAGTIIYYKPEYWLADPICTYVFSILVFFTVKPITKQCIDILMETTPSEINVEKIIKDIKENTTAQSVHDFHCWSLSVGRHSLSCHVESDKPMQTLQEVTELCKNKYNIDHLTIQMEDTSAENSHYFNC
jgi:zinc transporter 2